MGCTSCKVTSIQQHDTQHHPENTPTTSSQHTANVVVEKNNNPSFREYLYRKVSSSVAPNDENSSLYTPTTADDDENDDDDNYTILSRERRSSIKSIDGYIAVERETPADRIERMRRALESATEENPETASMKKARRASTTSSVIGAECPLTQQRRTNLISDWMTQMERVMNYYHSLSFGGDDEAFPYYSDDGDQDEDPDEDDDRLTCTSPQPDNNTSASTFTIPSPLPRLSKTITSASARSASNVHLFHTPPEEDGGSAQLSLPLATVRHNSTLTEVSLCLHQALIAQEESELEVKLFLAKGKK
eukprot:PhM_4_TR10878/c0_g1_i1/m.16009